MCGITGTLSTDPSRYPIDQALIRRMRDALIHRGPDDAGEYFSPDGQLGFGFRRLSIIDLSPAGHQPMSNEDGTIWIVFNGEIYNHASLRQGLIDHGHTYRSKSDTETIIHLYEEKGIMCLQELRGMFGLAIWDQCQNQLFIARDRIGVKPVYYTTHQGQFRFASEIKALLEDQTYPREINRQGLYDYLTYFSVPAPDTLFTGIHKIPAGHYLQVDRKGVELHKYWDIPLKTDSSKTEEDWISLIRTELKESVRLRNMSDVPFGAFLSGGIDSSLITVLMNQLLHQPIKTFTVAFKDDDENNELKYAQQIRDQYHTDYHDIYIGQKELFQYLPKLIHTQDEPIADWVCFPLYYVSKLIRDNKVIVAQVGEGSDELFCGYDGFLKTIRRYNKVDRYYQLLPGFIKKAIYAAAKRLPPYRHRTISLEHFRRKAHNEFPFWGGAICYTEGEKQLLLTDTFCRQVKNSYWMVEKYLNDLHRQNPRADFLQKMTYLEFKQRLPELLLMRVDKVTMSTSIEARVPFLDYRFVEQMAGIPTKFKIKGGVGKAILKKSAESIIPSNIIYREKVGFGAPIAIWLSEKRFNNIFRRLVLQSSIMEQEIFKKAEVDKLFSEQLSGHGQHSLILWLIINVTLWYDFWIARRDIRANLDQLLAMTEELTENSSGLESWRH